MMQTEEIRHAFCASGRESLIALDWESDMEPLIGSGEDVQFLSLTGDTVTALVGQLKDDKQLLTTRQIVFELIINHLYQLPSSEMARLSDYLAAIPSTPEILWGCSRAPEQPENLKLNLIFI